MLRDRVLAIAAALLFLSPGLAYADDHNLSAGVLTVEPKIMVASPPSFQAWEHRTFSVFPISAVVPQSNLSGLIEMQLLFSLRNALEARGYVYVTPDRSPDLWVTLEAANPYHEKYVPPRTVQVPEWVPGATVRLDLRGSTFGSGGYSWGTYSGSARTSGYWTTRGVTRSGYLKGSYYPGVEVYVIDGRSYTLVWQGAGVASSRAHDIRLSSQVVLRYVIERFPRRRPLSAAVEVATEAADSIARGIAAYIWIFTADGNSFYPTVLSVQKGSGAEKAGLKPYDMLAVVDGTPMLNRPYADALEALASQSSDPARVTVKRLNKEFALKVPRDALISRPERLDGGDKSIREPRETPSVSRTQPPSFCDLRILSVPEEADVYLGPVRVGATTADGLVLRDLAAGTILFEVRRKGYATVQHSVVCQPGEEATAEVRLPKN